MCFFGFNSLQTGKYIQRRYLKPYCSKHILVSIPFKRESISKVKIKKNWSGDTEGVSIPFKRESISKGIELITKFYFFKEFQFPSNGKVYPKRKKWQEEKNIR